MALLTKRGLLLLGWLAGSFAWGQADGVQRLFFPWVSNRDGQFESALVLNNVGKVDVWATLTAFRGNGETATATRLVKAGGFLEERAASLFPALGSGDGYAVLAVASGCNLHGAWVTNSLSAASGASPAQGAAVTIPKPGQVSSRAGQTLYFGHLPVEDGLISAPVFANIGNQPTDATLRFFDASGEQTARVDLDNLEPYRPFAATANGLLPEDAGAVHMIAEAKQPLAGAVFVFDSVFREAAIGNAVNAEEAALGEGPRALIYPWISNREGLFESVLIAGNLGDAAVEATLTARRGADPDQQDQATRMIPPGGFLRETASSLFPKLGSGAGYTVTLESPSATVAGLWLTHNLAADSGRSPSMGVAVPWPAAGSDRIGQSLLFSYLPRAGAVSSAPVAVNIGAEAADLDFRYRDAAGRVVSELTYFSAPPFTPVVVAPEDLPGDGRSLYLTVGGAGEAVAGAAFIFNGAFNEPAISNATAVDLSLGGGDATPAAPLFADVTGERVSSPFIGAFHMDAMPGDLDGDGDLDLAVAGEFARNVILINDGSGRFQDETTDRLPFSRRDSEDIALADFDGDGDLDFIAVSEDDAVNELYINDGRGFFSEEAAARLPVAGISNAVVAADLNGDGAPDLLIGNNGRNAALINNGAGVFVDETELRLPPLFDITQDLELGDVDGDGDLDLLVGNENQNRLLINNGAGVFADESTQRLTYRATAEETREADFGDIDGDGDLDILFANTALFIASLGDAGNRLLINNGDGFFTDGSAARLPPDTDVALDGDFIDLDGDCDLDIVTANVTRTPGGLGPAPFRAYLNNGRGFFVEATDQVFPAGLSANGLDVEYADFNGDGLIDLYLCSRGGSDRLLLGVRP